MTASCQSRHLSNRRSNRHLIIQDAILLTLTYVDKILGLRRSNELSYESRCAKVKPIEEARDKVATESGFTEACAELMAKQIQSFPCHRGRRRRRKENERDEEVSFFDFTVLAPRA